MLCHEDNVEIFWHMSDIKQHSLSPYHTCLFLRVMICVAYAALISV